MNLHYSRFSDSAPIELNSNVKKARTSTAMNNQDGVSMTLLLKRLEKLDTIPANVTPTSTSWEKDLDRRLQGQMVEFKAQFDAKLLNLEKKTEQRLQHLLFFYFFSIYIFGFFTD